MSPDYGTYTRNRKRRKKGGGFHLEDITWKDVFTPRVLVAIPIIAVILLSLTLILMFLYKPNLPGTGQASAAVTSLPAPTVTPQIAAVTPTQPADAQPTATLQPGEIGIGVYVQITGTGGSGLHVRSEPGLNTNSIFLGRDSEAFQVVDGPRQADGHTWWKLLAPYDSTRTGWAAQDYLVVITSP